MAKTKVKKLPKSKWAEDYQNVTGMELMEPYPGESMEDCAKRNIKWLRDWAEECAQGFERDWGLYR